jgi:hypothetical protein
MLLLLAALFLASPMPPVPKEAIARTFPTVNLSAIRMIACEGYTGSGYLIGDDILATDLHVADGEGCYDVASLQPLTMYKKDPKKDFALMTGKLPNMPYIKYSCERYKKGQTYTAYGISGYLTGSYIFRAVTVKSTGKYESFAWEDGGNSSRISVYQGVTVPGMSGGPIVDERGYAHGNVVGGQKDRWGIPNGKGYSYELADTFLCQ